MFKLPSLLKGAIWCDVYLATFTVILSINYDLFKRRQEQDGRWQMLVFVTSDV